MTSYTKAGVDLEAAARWVGKLKGLSSAIGGFGGFYPLGEDFLVASTDGVGTKLKLAFALDKHDTVGIDLVAMNVNDILTSGAKPLFFLDYIATSKLDVPKMESIIAGIVQGCEMAGCALIGGETAQMNDFYADGHYDLAGFAVGIVKQSERIDGSSIQKGDCLVGLPSSGPHSNGFSLIRKIVQESEYSAWADFLMAPTRIYVKEVEGIRSKFVVKGMAHITGGSFAKNIPRMLPKGLGAQLTWGSFPVPSVFDHLQEKGGISNEEMRRVFNMGIGFVLCLSPEEAALLCKESKGYLIGEVIDGEGVTWK